MRLAVLASEESWYLADLRRAGGAEHEIAAVSFRELASAVADNSMQVTTAAANTSAIADLSQFDAILIRTMPPGSLEQVVFRMDVLGTLESQGMLIVNAPRAIEVAVDKFLALTRLARAGLRVPKTFVCQTAAQGIEAFDELGGDAVLKPLFGSEGRGITRIVDRVFAERAFRLLVDRGEVLYLQEFIKHPGYDVRVLRIGERALALLRRNANDWRTNLSLGGRAERIEPTAELLDGARRAAEAVGARMAGVDLIQAADGQWYVLEVNAVPGWKASAAALNVDVARLVLDDLALLVRERGGR